MIKLIDALDIGEAIEKGIIPKEATVHIRVIGSGNEDVSVSIFDGSPEDIPYTLKRIPCKYLVWDVEGKEDIKLSVLFLYILDIPESWLLSIKDKYRNISEDDLKYSYMKELIKHARGENNFFKFLKDTGMGEYYLSPPLYKRNYLLNSIEQLISTRLKSNSETVI